MWFVFVVDRAGLEELKKAYPDWLESIQESIECFAMHVQYRRLRWIQTHLLQGTNLQLTRIQACDRIDLETRSAYERKLFELMKKYYEMTDEIIALHADLKDKGIGSSIFSHESFIVSFDQKCYAVYKMGRRLYTMGNLIERLDAYRRKRGSTP